MIKRGLNLLTFVALSALLLPAFRASADDSRTMLIQVHIRGTAIQDDPEGSDKPEKVSFTEADFLSVSNSLLVARINLGLSTETGTNATVPDFAFNLEEWNDVNGNGQLDTGDTLETEIFFASSMVLLANGRFNATIATDSDSDTEDNLVGHAITLNVRGRSKLKDLNNDGQAWEIRDFKSDVIGGDLTLGLMLDGKLNTVGKAIPAFDEEEEDVRPARSKFSRSHFKNP